jgi:isocitrate dehydrogenase
VFYKAPITTPQGGGYKSLNVTIRKTLGLYANVRPCVSYAPFVETHHPKMDLVIVRENEEDLYAGIEHRQSDEVFQCLKLISRPGCEKIVRYAFEYARANHRRKVSCFTKDNIMKMTDGLFHKVFDEIGAEYPEIEKDHWIIDIGMARVATHPERFDVIVTQLSWPARSAWRVQPISATMWPCSRPSTAPRPISPARIWPIRPACCWPA